MKQKIEKTNVNYQSMVSKNKNLERKSLNKLAIKDV
jgi:hypothetical protein